MKEGFRGFVLVTFPRLLGPVTYIRVDGLLGKQFDDGRSMRNLKRTFLGQSLDPIDRTSAVLLESASERTAEHFSGAS